MYVLFFSLFYSIKTDHECFCMVIKAGLLNVQWLYNILICGYNLNNPLLLDVAPPTHTPRNDNRKLPFKVVFSERQTLWVGHAGRTKPRHTHRLPFKLPVPYAKQTDFVLSSLLMSVPHKWDRQSLCPKKRTQVLWFKFYYAVLSKCFPFFKRHIYRKIIMRLTTCQLTSMCCWN